jgi:peroxidase
MRSSMFVAVLAATALSFAASGAAAPQVEVRSLDGSGNNTQHTDWGKARTQYLRVASPNYADGIRSMVSGPPVRYVSNRVFNDVGQNLFSENSVSQWGWAWGQFLDHDFGLRDETPGESAPIAFDGSDPLESFANDFGAIEFSRTPAAPGTGVSGSPRQQINTISSFIDASNVYGVDASRLDWLREGTVDGNPANNGPRLFLSDGYLPAGRRAGQRLGRSADGPDGPARRQPRSGDRGGGRPREREHRAYGDPHADGT